MAKNDNKFYTGSIKTLDQTRSALIGVKERINKINNTLKQMTSILEFSEFFAGEEEQEEIRELIKTYQEFQKETKKFYDKEVKKIDSLLKKISTVNNEDLKKDLKTDLKNSTSIAEKPADEKDLLDLFEQSKNTIHKFKRHFNYDSKDEKYANKTDYISEEMKSDPELGTWVQKMKEAGENQKNSGRGR